MDLIRSSVSLLATYASFTDSSPQSDQLPLRVLKSKAPPACVNPPVRNGSDPFAGVCPLDPISCTPTVLSGTVDSCCVNAPGGLFALAQFWDVDPAIGPNDRWTLHGLWPDYCESGFPCNCNPKRNLTGCQIDSIVKSSRPELYQYIKTNWIGINGDQNLWFHEWDKHGTCVSTLNPECYDSPAATQDQHLDLLDYFTAATEMHKSLDTYHVLAKHNIIPDQYKEYTLDEITNALTAEYTGLIPYVSCNRTTNALQEIWLPYHVRGSFRNATAEIVNQFIPAEKYQGKNNCPATGVKYLPKSTNKLREPKATCTA